MAKMGLGKGLDLLLPKAGASEKNPASEPKTKETVQEESFETKQNIDIEDQVPELREEPIQFAAENEASVSKADTPRPDIKDGYISDTSTENIVTLRISKIEPNKEQSRKTFDEVSLEELSQSIKQYGIIQPIVVCKKGDYYEIIAGERRWRAAKKAGLTEVPVVIRNYEDKERAEVSLIENIQRENLNPIEEAAAYKQLMDEYDLTQETLAIRVSKSRAAVANMMRLLKLNPEVQQMVVEGKLSGGHARALLGIEDSEGQLNAAKKVISNNLNVRQTEDLVKALNTPDKKPSAKRKSAKPHAAVFKDLENRLTEVLGTKVRINHQEKGNGKIEIDYFSEFELDRIYKIINSADADQF